jgi:photosystem II stability/assembly factor-like uncharacterized protein
MRRSALLFLIGILAGIVPASATYSASPTSTTNGGGTWGSILRMAASVSGTQTTFTVTKQSGTFTSAGTLYLREGSDTGTTRGSKAVAAGASSVTITLDLASLSGYPKSFYTRYESSIGGYAWVGPITISFANHAPGAPAISSSPASVKLGVPVSISVTRGSDTDGDRVKVQCTAIDSDRTSQSPYDSGLGTAGTTVTPSFVFSVAGSKIIYCTSFDENGAGSSTSSRTISVTANQPPSTPAISNSPATAYRGASVDVAVTRGTDPDGDSVKVQCTAIDSNRTDASPYVSSFATGNTVTTASFAFNLVGTKTIYCTSFDNSGAASPVASRTIQVNDPTPTGSLTAPTGSVTGPVNIVASATAPVGLHKVSVVFASNGIPYALCENNTAKPCPATSGAWNEPGVDPRWYSAMPGTLSVGLWVLDDVSSAGVLVNQRTITWQPAATGTISSPSGTGAGLITVAASATAAAGLKKVSVVFVPNGTPLVLCDDARTNPCQSGSWSMTGVNPRDYSVTGASALTLGLWVADDQGRVENVFRQPYQWAPAGTGAFSSPSGAVTGPIRITANASAPSGLKKVSVVFVSGGPAFVLCEDGTPNPCPAGTSGQWDRSAIDPRTYGVTGPGTVTLGLWILDDQNHTDLVASQPFQWQASTPPIYLNVSDWAQAAADYLVTHGIVNDTPNHDLRGTSVVNRAELATMIYRSLGGGQANADGSFASWYGGDPTPRFIDVVDPAVWYFKAATYLGGLDFADGVTVFDQEPGIFRPANSISRAWAVKALLEAWNIPPLTSFSGITLFSDVPTSHPAAGYIYQAWQKGIVTGTNNLFEPDAAAARQDLFVMLHRVLDAQANANALAIPSPAPLGREDFAAVRPLRRIGLRYEQPVLTGAQAPTVSLTVTPLARETVGPLTDVFTSMLAATLSGIDAGTFVDSRGESHTAHPFCAWSAASGSFVDLTPPGAVPFSRVRWLAPADVSAASGSAAAYVITVFCGDGLGHEVRASQTLTLSARGTDSTLPTVSLSPLPTGKIAGQVANLDGTARDGGDANAPDYGILRVELSFSLDGGVTWSPLGEAPLDAQGAWHFSWLLPAYSGMVWVQAQATNLRGNSAQVQSSVSILPALAIAGSVVDGAGLPLENALVTLAGGSLNTTAATDGNGAFAFGNATGTTLQTGVPYTLTASFASQSATAAGLTLTSQSSTLDQVLTLDLAPPATAASVPGGTYGVPQSVELVCVDDHSGCSATYYTLDGTVPGLTSPRYTAPIPIVQSTTLRFFSIDSAGNREVVVTESYAFQTCNFAIDPASASFDGAGGTDSVAVTAPGGCSWTAASAQSWVNVTDGASGDGDGNVFFAVAANPGTVPRTGTLTIAGYTFTVSQSGAGTVTFTLTVNKLGSGSGRVTSTPAGIDCGLSCSETLQGGSQVNLQAVSDPGSGPVVWGGDPDCVDGTVTLSADRLCTATFELATGCSGVWTSGGPLGGTVRLVWVDPARPSHLLAGGDGGLFESQDGGESWIATSLGARPVYALAVDPSAPATWYAASYIYVFKSTDAGLTWSVSSMAPGTGSVISVAVNPTSPSLLWAGLAWPGLVKSTDAGSTWSAVNIGVTSTSVTAIVFDPSQPRTIYFATQGSGIGKSTDAGANWRPMNQGLTSLWVRNLWIDRRSSSTLFATTTSGIHRSTDGGATWRPVVATGEAALAQAPGELSTFYASDGGTVWKSLDGGVTWNPTGTVSFAGAALGLTVSPLSSSTVYMATAGRGLLVSIDGGKTWREVNLGLPNFVTFGVTAEPGNPSTAYTSHSAGGLFKTTDGGGQWTSTARGSLQGSILDVAAGSRSALYVAAQGGVFKSLDHGTSWSNVTGGLAGLFPLGLAVPTADSDTVYVLANGSLYKSSDGAQSWGAIGAGLGNTSRVEVHPNNPAKVLALTREAGIGKLFRSVDGGSTWSLGGSGLPAFDVNDLAFDPSLPATVYAVAGSGLYRSTDGGMSWSALSTLPMLAYAVTVHPALSSVLYVGTWGSGVYRSLNGGISWSAWNEGLPAREITSLTAMGLSPAVLYAATDTRGIYQISECSDYPLTVARLGTGSGTITSAPAGINCGADCSELYPLGTEVQLTAQAAAGSQFTGWSGEGCSGTGECRVVMGQARSVTATFSQQSWPLTVSRSGSGSGRVVSQPAGIDCGAACTATFAAETVVTLAALPDAGSTFAGWTGDCTNGQVTLSAARSCGATFIPQAAPGLGFYTVTPCRMLDTRSTGPLVSGVRKSIQLAGICGIPATAISLSVNVTTVGATGLGGLVVWPGGTTKPGTTVISFRPSDARANNAIFTLAPAGEGGGSVLVEATVAGGGAVHLIIDVNGYFQ